MELDLEQVAILLQKRYNCLREAQRITKDMKESIARQDEVSVALLLNMRGEELAKYDAMNEELWKQASGGYTAFSELNRLLKTDPDQILAGKDPMEAKIVEIRKKTKKLIQDMQCEEKLIKRQITGRQ